ncbi:histidine phosphatase family protein, partial [Spirochaetota bacterium]
MTVSLFRQKELEGVKGMVEILLIRHGETDYNRNGVILGQTDVSLNKKGIEQGKVLKDRLKDEKIDAAYSSDLKRCVEICDLIEFDCEVKSSKNLREMDMGDWDGRDFNHVKEKFPEEYEAWKNDWVNYPVPGGESFIEMSKRVLAEFEKIRNSREEGKIAVVSHGGSIRTILGHYI